jgi:hypothetical protein
MITAELEIDKQSCLENLISAKTELYIDQM